MILSKRFFIAMVGFALMGFSLAACSGATDDPTKGSGGSSSDAGSLHIGVTIHQADVYFQQVANAVQEEVESEGGEFTLVNTETDPGTEASGFQNLVTRQVDGIVTSPLSPVGSLASIESAADSGIPIVCYNTCLEDENEELVEAFIESDQKNLGKQTGQFAVEYLKEEGKTSITLGMLNCNRYEACKDRQTGFLEALEAGGIDVSIAADQEALAVDEASNKTTDILTANPKIDVFWSSSQGPTEGMVAAVNAAGKGDQVSLFGTDVSKSLVRSIQDGDLVAITGQDSEKTGELAVEYIEKAINGEDISPFKTTIPGNLYSVDGQDLLEEYLQSR